MLTVCLKAYPDTNRAFGMPEQAAERVLPPDKKRSSAAEAGLIWRVCTARVELVPFPFVHESGNCSAACEGIL